MAEITIGRMAKLYGLHRSSLYEAVSKGRVTAGFNGKGQRVIDLAEMIRVYGEPPGQSDQTRQKPTPDIQGRQTPDSDLMLELVELNRRQADHLEHMAARIESLEATMRALPSPAEAGPPHSSTNNGTLTPSKSPKSLADVLARFEARSHTH